MTSEDTSIQPGKAGQDDAARRVREQIEDALELARFVVETGVKDADGQPLSFADIGTVETTATTLGVLDLSGSAASSHGLTNDQWIAFELAYYRLALATSPVTAETLRNTRYVAGASGAAARHGWLTWCGLFMRLCGYSPAQRFTRWLWLITIGFALWVLVTEYYIDALGMVADADKVKVKKDLWEAVQPWAYGGLGSCAYLLRSGHYYIYARSFDLRRQPEYFNRILLGADLRRRHHPVHELSGVAGRHLHPNRHHGARFHRRLQQRFPVQHHRAHRHRDFSESVRGDGSARRSVEEASQSHENERRFKRSFERQFEWECEWQRQRER